MSDAATNGCRQVSVHGSEPVEYLLESWACPPLAEFAHNLVEVRAANLACFRVHGTERPSARCARTEGDAPAQSRARTWSEPLMLLGSGRGRRCEGRRGP